MDSAERKLIVKRLSKIFDNQISNDIEQGILNFSEQYAETQDTPFLLVQIYQDKSDELLNILENKNNKTLINAIKKKTINPIDVGSLKPQELNPEKYEKITKKKELEEYNKNKKASTDLFKCSKCKKKKCVVTEKQTQAGDEPATTFVECLECGNVWRHH
jgi:DNA-directed RNA polymerase subunit M/transcription elongation factor TFIIS